MPTLSVRDADQVPTFRKPNTAALVHQQLYEGFIREAGSENVGELSLDEGEQSRSVKVRLRRAANRMGVNVEIWDADSKVYFKSAASAPKRGRSKKA